MSGPDFPDFQRGGVAPGAWLASFDGDELGGTVYPPANTDVLWIDGAQQLLYKPQVLDADSGLSFPVFPIKYNSNGGVPGYYWVALIEIQSVGQGIAIEWIGRGAVGWSVFAQSGGRIVHDLAVAAVSGFQGGPVDGPMVLVGGWDGTDYRALLTDTTGKLAVSGSADGAIGAPGSPPPADAVQVAGTDGTDLRALKTDSAGVLQVSGSSFPTVYGPPGAAVPADAIMVAGSDGTDLRVLLTDGSGHVLPIDQNLKLVIGALATALPSDAVLIAGTDGSDLRALLLDSSGHALTIDQTLKNVIAAVNTAAPADAVLVAGSDGTDLRPFFTDVNGRPLTKDFYLSISIGAIGAAVPFDAMATGVSDGTDLRIMRANEAGIVYAIPSAPATAASDHPPNELGLYYVLQAAPLAAPGGTKRYRIFAVYPAGIPAADSGYLTFQPLITAGAGTYLAFGGASAQYMREHVTLPVSGLACAPNTAITWTDAVGTNGAMVLCTIETN